MISYGIFLLLVIVVYNAVSIKLATVLTTYLSRRRNRNAANILTIMQLASVAARSLFGWLQAKAYRYMLTLSLLLMGIGFVLIATVP